jgi:hypothetical protein
MFSAPATPPIDRSRSGDNIPRYLSTLHRNAFCNSRFLRRTTMFLQRLLMSAVGIAAFGTISLAAANAAQWPHHGWHHGGEHWGPMYDTRNETRVTGSVEAVKNVAGRDDGYCCGAGGGTHVTLKTATESIDVHLGPTVSLREQGLNLAAIRWKSWDRTSRCAVPRCCWHARSRRARRRGGCVPARTQGRGVTAGDGGSHAPSRTIVRPLPTTSSAATSTGP